MSLTTARVVNQEPWWMIQKVSGLQRCWSICALIYFLDSLQSIKIDFWFGVDTWLLMTLRTSVLINVKSCLLFLWSVVDGISMPVRCLQHWSAPFQSRSLIECSLLGPSLGCSTRLRDFFLTSVLELGGPHCAYFSLSIASYILLNLILFCCLRNLSLIPRKNGFEYGEVQSSPAFRMLVAPALHVHLRPSVLMCSCLLQPLKFILEIWSIEDGTLALNGFSSSLHLDTYSSALS